MIAKLLAFRITVGLFVAQTFESWEEAWIGYSVGSSIYAMCACLACATQIHSCGESSNIHFNTNGAENTKAYFGPEIGYMQLSRTDIRRWTYNGNLRR
jgi:hypothetical protein